jgi:hypothetical protein
MRHTNCFAPIRGVEAITEGLGWLRADDDRMERRAPSHGPNGGAADSLDDAKAAFRAAWGRQRALSDDRT